MRLSRSQHSDGARRRHSQAQSHFKSFSVLHTMQSNVSSSERVLCFPLLLHRLVTREVIATCADVQHLQVGQVCEGALVQSVRRQTVVPWTGRRGRFQSRIQKKPLVTLPNHIVISETHLLSCTQVNVTWLRWLNQIPGALHRSTFWNTRTHLTIIWKYLYMLLRNQNNWPRSRTHEHAVHEHTLINPPSTSNWRKQHSNSKLAQAKCFQLWGILCKKKK